VSRGAGRRRRGRELALRVLFELEGTQRDPVPALAYQAEEIGALQCVSKPLDPMALLGVIARARGASLATT